MKESHLQALVTVASMIPGTRVKVLSPQPPAGPGKRNPDRGATPILPGRLTRSGKLYAQNFNGALVDVTDVPVRYAKPQPRRARRLAIRRSDEMHAAAAEAWRQDQLTARLQRRHERRQVWA